MSLQSKQPFLNQFLERVGEFCARAVRRLSVLVSRLSPPSLLTDSLSAPSTLGSESCSYFSPSYLVGPSSFSSPSSVRRRASENSPPLLSSLLARWEGGGGSMYFTYHVPHLQALALTPNLI